MFLTWLVGWVLGQLGHQLAHERLALPEFGCLDPLVRLVGLLDGAGAADDGRDSDLLEEARLGAVADRMGGIRPGKMERQGFRRAVLLGRQAGDAVDRLGGDARLGGQRLHRGFQLAGEGVEPELSQFYEMEQSFLASLHQASSKEANHIEPRE